LHHWLEKIAKPIAINGDESQLVTKESVGSASVQELLTTLKSRKEAIPKPKKMTCSIKAKPIVAKPKPRTEDQFNPHA
jgi:hypothetical protein